MIKNRSKFHLFFVGFALLAFGFGCGSNISGKVVDKATGKPVKGVTIIGKANINIVEDKKYSEKRTISNSDGEFILKGLSPKYNYRIEVSKSGYFQLQDSFLSKTPPEGGKTIELSRPLYLSLNSSINGKVIDKFSGKGLPNINVSAKIESKGYTFGQSTNLYEQYRFSNTTTDSNGNFQLLNIYPLKEYNISASGDEYTSSSIRYSRKYDQFDIENPIIVLKSPRESGIYSFGGNVYKKFNEKFYHMEDFCYGNRLKEFKNYVLYFRNIEDLEHTTIEKANTSHIVIATEDENKYYGDIICPIYKHNKGPEKIQMNNFCKGDERIKRPNFPSIQDGFYNIILAGKPDNANSYRPTMPYFVLQKEYKPLEWNHNYELQGFLPYEVVYSSSLNKYIALIDVTKLEKGFYLLKYHERGYYYTIFRIV